MDVVQIVGYLQTRALATWATEGLTVSGNMPWKLKISAIMKEVRLERSLLDYDSRSPGGSALIFIGEELVGQGFYDTEPSQGLDTSKWLLSFADRFALLGIDRGSRGLVVEPTQNDMEFRRIGSFELIRDHHLSYDRRHEDRSRILNKEKRTWITLV